MKNILLPTDFSENSLNAINYAINLFKNEECTFFLLNVQKQSDIVLDDFMTEASNTSIHSTITNDNKTKLKLFSETIKTNHADKELQFKLMFDYDNLVNAIKEVIIAKKIDLIVMGTNGASNIKEIIFGSNTLKVINKIEFPILIVPNKYVFKKLNSVLFSVKNYEDFTKENIKPLEKVINSCDINLTILDFEANRHSNYTVLYEPYLKELFNKKHLNYYKVEDVPVPMVVSTMSQIFNYELHVFFMKLETDFLEHFFYNSNNQEIIYKTKTPLLILKK